MYEYQKDNVNTAASVNTSNSFTYNTPRIKRVTVTETIYDANGNIIKETCTDTEYTDGGTYYPHPWQYPYSSYTVNNDGSSS